MSRAPQTLVEYIAGRHVNGRTGGAGFYWRRRIGMVWSIPVGPFKTASEARENAKRSEWSFTSEPQS